MSSQDSLNALWQRFSKKCLKTRPDNQTDGLLQHHVHVSQFLVVSRGLFRLLCSEWRIQRRRSCGSNISDVVTSMCSELNVLQRNLSCSVRGLKTAWPAVSIVNPFFFSFFNECILIVGELWKKMRSPPSIRPTRNWLVDCFSRLSVETGVIGHHKSEKQLRGLNQTIWNQTRAINTILWKDIPSFGVFMMMICMKYVCPLRFALHFSPV